MADFRDTGNWAPEPFLIPVKVQARGGLGAVVDHVGPPGTE